ERGLLRGGLAVTRDRQTGRGVETAWRGELGRQVVLVTCELSVADVALGGHSLVNLELQVKYGCHFDGGPTALTVALREVRVADREETASLGHGARQPD